MRVTEPAPPGRKSAEPGCFRLRAREHGAGRQAGRKAPEKIPGTDSDLSLFRPWERGIPVPEGTKPA